VQQFGRTSLFIYWIHVEMVYGVISKPLHRTLTLPEWFGAYMLFLALLLCTSVAKDALVARTRSGRRARPGAASPAQLG
jgi:hypothetical protein